MSYETTTNRTSELNDFDKPKLPTMLNVLTILTFIGCAIQLLFAIYGFATAQKTYDEKDALIAKMNSPEMPAFARRMVGDPEVYEKTITKSLENKIPILIVSLVAIGLCFYGALQMRKLNKQGYLIYLVGQILPFISMLIFIGAFAMKGSGFYFGTGITLLFILLYTTQRKYLIY